MEIEWNIPLIEVEGVVKGVIVDGREFDCTTSELINIYTLLVSFKDIKNKRMLAHLNQNNRLGD